MGRGGLYYRTSLAGGNKQKYQTDGAHEESASLPDELKDIESSSVLDMVDASSADLLAEFNSKLKKVRIGPILIGFCLVGYIFFNTESGLPQESIILYTFIAIIMIGLAFYYDLMSKSIVLFYDLTEGVDESYQKLHNAFDKLMTCSKAFHIEAKGKTTDWKRSAGASYLVRRKNVVLSKTPPPFFKTNISVPMMPVGRQKLYFFPDRLLIFENNEVGAVSYRALKIDIEKTRFIEEDQVPDDAEVVDYTWRYVNKKGGPDRRFNNNRKLPVLLYESLYFNSPSGLDELMYLSRVNLGLEFQQAITALAESSSGALALEERGSPPGKKSFKIKGKESFDFGRVIIAFGAIFLFLGVIWKLNVSIRTGTYANNIKIQTSSVKTSDIKILPLPKNIEEQEIVVKENGNGGYLFKK